MKIDEIYDRCDKIGSLSFSTWTGSEVETRIAMFFAYDDEGIYFRTMSSKPFYKQIVQFGKLAVCGMYPQTQVDYDENRMPFFNPGYTIRLTGDVRELSLTEVEKKAETDQNFNVAVYDIKKYPETRVFVLYKAYGEVYDFDYGMRTRDHKLLRTAFAFGGADSRPAGLRINESCTGCGACEQVCTFKAITAGTPYRITGERCEECGNCYGVCPVNAIELR